MGMLSRRLIVAVAMLASATGCMMPTRYSAGPAVHYDKDTEYAVDERPNGFSLTIYYSRYQFIPENDALVVACKQALTSLAYDIAEQRGRKIERIEEQRIKISFGRNGLTGITSCTASSPVEWAKS
jgi:hypothetical protein